MLSRGSLRFNNQSILIKVITVLLGCVLFISFALSIFLYITEDTKLQKNLTDSLSLTSKRLAFNLVEPVWNINTTDTENIISFEMLNQYVTSIIVKNESDAYLLGKIKDTAGNVTEVASDENYQKIKADNKLVIKNDILRDNNKIGSLEIYYNKNQIKDEIAFLILRLVLQTLFLTIAIIVVIYFTFKSLVLNPITKLNKILKEFASGKGDLTKRIEIVSEDEIGLFSRYFNDFVSSLNLIIKNIKNVSEKTRDIGTNLAVSSEETSTELNKIQKNIENMKNKIVFLDGEISRSKDFSGEVKAIIEKVDNLMNSQTMEVDESFSKIKEMLSSIQLVVKSTEEKLEFSVNLQNIAKSGEQMMLDTITVIKKISDSTSVIMNLINVINETAAQTNILAMNASIEASHAGTFGKGFAVVANEIKKLAENTGVSSKGVSKSLNELMGFMRVSKDATEKTGVIFRDMVSGINEVSGSIIEVKNKMQELSAGSIKISDTLNALKRVTGDVKVSYSEVDQNVKLITESLDKVNYISNETKIGMEVVSFGVGELTTAGQKIANAGSQNVESIEELESLIEEFKVEA